MPDQVLERFWDKVEVDPITQCWNWIASLQKNGYAKFKYNKKMVYAHRFAFEVNNGKIPEDKELDHLCKNRKCVNPEHLEIVTSQENSLRGSGIPAINSQKTHCNKGHEFTPENTYIKPDGCRECKTCKRNGY